MEGFEATVNGQTSVPRFRLVLLLSLDHLFCSGLLCIFGSSPIVRIRELLTNLVWFYAWDWFNKPIAFIVWVSGAVDVFDHRNSNCSYCFLSSIVFLRFVRWLSFVVFCIFVTQIIFMCFVIFAFIIIEGFIRVSIGMFLYMRVAVNFT